MVHFYSIFLIKFNKSDEENEENGSEKLEKAMKNRTLEV
jgi:hypothetical protein